MVLACKVRVARSVLDRLRGLLGQRPLDAQEAIWLEPCNGVHTFGLGYPIAVIVLDEQFRVLKVVPIVAPNRVVLPVRGGRVTIEAAAQPPWLSELHVGDRLSLRPPE